MSFMEERPTAFFVILHITAMLACHIKDHWMSFDVLLFDYSSFMGQILASDRNIYLKQLSPLISHL